MIRFLIGLGVATIGILLFVGGVFYWHSAAAAVAGFLFGAVGIFALRGRD